jgi:hypothetical protein
LYLGSTVDTHSITKEVFSIVGFQQRSIRHLPIIRFNQLGQASYDQLQTFKPFSVVSLTRGGQLVSHHISTLALTFENLLNMYPSVPLCCRPIETVCLCCSVLNVLLRFCIWRSFEIILHTVQKLATFFWWCCLLAARFLGYIWFRNVGARRLVTGIFFKQGSIVRNYSGLKDGTCS